MQCVCVLSSLRQAPGQSIVTLTWNLRGLLTTSEMKEGLDWLIAKGWVYIDEYDEYVAHPSCLCHTSRIYSDLRHVK